MTDIFPVSNIDSRTSVFVGCIGYEDRSSYLLREDFNDSEISHVLFDYRAVDGDGVGLCSYDRNLEIAKRMGAKLEPDFNRFLEILSSTIGSQQNPNLILDITSFDRSKMAELLLQVFRLKDALSQIRLMYSPRTFQPFEMVKFDVVQSFGPVLPEFFGSADGFEKPLSLVLGAGYEFGKAVGAVDTLEPDHIYCFRPTGTDPRFDQHIDQANVNFSFMDKQENIFGYDLNDAYTLYSDLRRLVEYEGVERSVLLLPLGPKLFAALSILIATVLHPTVMVWRHSTVSAAQPETITDAETTGAIVEFAFRFAK
ncbi:hypothetical protein JDO7802_00103 [Jannaschia donghaensis]|uniref:Uncharacterized protein n=2 Tax=Jannaschia donghaensis TaxID=420998 RepID=A0A0M6YCL4_9RHOB|nr:hypothetical protein JDO7802_00103 [Jannaschia donghaensis]